MKLVKRQLPETHSILHFIRLKRSRHNMKPFRSRGSPVKLRWPARGACRRVVFASSAAEC